MSKPEQLSEHLFLFKDTCNVYILVDGDQALVIDCGAASVLEHLSLLNVNQIEWVLFTHHHRDQAQGAHYLASSGAKLAVPYHERFLFDEVENYWRNRRTFDQINVRNTDFSLLKNVPITQELFDYSEFVWGNFKFEIIATPGHTLGSISLLSDIDDCLVAFTGDLIAAPGKVLTMYDMQMEYGGLALIDQTILSLDNLQRRKPSILCPSHGDPIYDAEEAINLLEQKLSNWYEFCWAYGKDPIPAAHSEIVEVTPHLITVPSACSNFYCLISENGKALLLDYGFPTINYIKYAVLHPGESPRFIEHSLDRIMDHYDIDTIDVVIPTHYHDDHIAGMPYLKRRFGTRIWAYQNMVDILEHPGCKNVPCIYPEPMKVDRVIQEGEKVKWENYEFTVVQFPGHTEYQSAIFCEIDGRRIAFTGDNLFKVPEVPFLAHHLVYRNEHHINSQEIAARKLIDYEPDILCPGHFGPINVTREDLEEYLERALKQKKFFQDLIDNRSPNYGLNPNWARIYPYQIRINTGNTANIEFHLNNYYNRKIKFEAEWILPAGWNISPEQFDGILHSSEMKIVKCQLAVPGSTSKQMHVPIAIDISIDNKRLGQVTEALVSII